MLRLARGGLHLVVAVMLGYFAGQASAAEPSPALAEFNLKTRWADLVDRQLPLDEYPRPQLSRDNWTNLNGPWQYAITPRDAERPSKFDGEILVPFPVESQLSGVRREVGATNVVWYRRTFGPRTEAEQKRVAGRRVDKDHATVILPAPKGSTRQLETPQRVLLHFGAVDWQTTVWVNGAQVGEHQGGYDPFTFDITDALKPDGAENELVVRVWDPTDAESQPRGKQQSKPEGIWYTPVTGIWQTVWLERVPKNYVRSLRVTPDLTTGTVTIRADVVGETTKIESTIDSLAGTGTIVSGEARGSAMTLKVPQPQAWSPREPYLYPLSIELNDSDQVNSYFAFRTIEVREAEDGHRRLFLNGKPLFQFGPLDQGWWPDGLYTAPTDEALRYDIEVTRGLGFNMIRKHVKVEPARWYFHCDRMGMIVWQDMPSAMRVPPGPEFVLPLAKKDFQRDEGSAKQFETELKSVIDALRPFPSIVMWVPFNEGWGQYDTARIARLTKEYDPTRLVNCPSGWTDREVGDVLDLHHYPGPTVEIPAAPRAGVLGEFGGLGWPVPDHLWWNKRNWGYRTYDSQGVLEARYRDLLHAMPGLIGRGLAAAVYTQTTDVEGEVNGLMTYDRALVKITPSLAKELAAPLYEKPAGVIEYVPSSFSAPQEWRIAREKPAAGWETPDFDDVYWKAANAPLVDGKPQGGLRQGDPWSIEEIWLRKTFDAQQLPEELYLQISHAAGVFEVYLNGRLVYSVEEGPIDRHYQHVRLDAKQAQLRQGKNVIAVRGFKANKPRAIDVGLYGTK